MLLFLACLPDADDKGDTAGDADTDADTDSDADTDADTDTDPCASTDPYTGPVTGGWSGDGETLLLAEDRGTFSDGCYGGHIDPPFEASAGAFSWSARIYESGGGPEPRDVLAVGCVDETKMELAIVETDGTPFWGPWHLVPDAEVTGIVLCD